MDSTSSLPMEVYIISLVDVYKRQDYTRDYEELYQDFNTKNGIVREMVDGKESELGLSLIHI